MDVSVTGCELFYFGLKTPVGLPIILALEAGGVEYKAHPCSFDEWSKLKPTTPTGVMPLCKLADGTTVIESGAILRAVGAQTGALGTSKDFLASEMLMGLNADLMKKAASNAPTVMTLKNWDAAKTAAAKEALPDILAHLAKYDQFLVGGDKFTSSGLSIGELQLFVMVASWSRAMPEIATPGLAAFMKRVAAVPAVAKVMDGASAWGDLPWYFAPFP